MNSASPTILRLSALVAATMLALSALGEDEAPLRPYPNVLPPQVDGFLAEGRFELLSLDPAILTKKQRRRLRGKLFHGYRVLGRVDIPKAPERGHLVQRLHEALASAGYGLAYCFDPRHAIRASVGARTVDLLICFECSKISVQLPDRSPKTRPAQFISTSASAQPAFDAALKSAGIPLGNRP
jgi:hypothetical protein